MAPACEHVAIQVSPEGRVALVRQLRSREGVAYFLDLVTGEVVEFKSVDNVEFLTDELLLVPYPKGQPYLLNRQTLERYSISRLYPERLPDGVLENGDINPNALLPILDRAGQIFIWDDWLVTVESHTTRDTSSNYLVSESNLFGESANGDLLRHFLYENEIPYLTSYRRYYPEGMPSHTGALLARDDGIYLASTGERIVEGFSAPSYGYLVPAGWAYNDRGVVLHPGEVFLLDLTRISLYLGRHILVPQPVLMLKVPDEYFTATQ
jgi:hypothetical protein